MKHTNLALAENRMRSRFGFESLSVLILALAYLIIELHAPLNHDVAWLLEAGARWMHGSRLYIDVMENNPPLVFFVYAGLTLGTFSKVAYIGAVIILMVTSSFWAARLNGSRWGAATFVICAVSGVMDFGQRDQLAAIVTIPYLWANKAKPRERALIGAWSFIGFGLKPQLMLIPAGATLARCLRDKTLRPAFAPENAVLVLLSAAYLAATVVFYPQFFTSMLPLVRLVYFAYGNGLGAQPIVLSLLLIAVVTVAIAALHRDLWPETGALAGAIGSYLIQGRFWSYHLVPALLVMFLLWLLMSRRAGRRRQFVLTLMLIATIGAFLFHSFRRPYQDVIPVGATSVLFLSSHVWSAYPAVVDRGVINASRYPALWTVPGARRLLRDPAASPEKRREAASVLAVTRHNLVDDIIRYCPDPIFADVRPSKPYYDGPFDFIEFLRIDPRFTGYRAGETAGMYQVYHRTTACPNQALLAKTRRDWRVAGPAN
jgi:hypothetical protein